MVKALGIFLSKILGEDIMTCGGQTIAAHTAIITLLIGCLSSAGESYDDIPRTNIGIVDNITAFHTAGDGRVDDDGADKVAHVCRLTTSRINANPHLTQFGKQLIRTVDDGRDDLTGHQHLITSDGTADKDIVDGTHTEQVVGIHYDSILGDTLPYGEVTRLLPVHIGKT